MLRTLLLSLLKAVLDSLIASLPSGSGPNGNLKLQLEQLSEQASKLSGPPSGSCGEGNSPGKCDLSDKLSTLSAIPAEDLHARLIACAMRAYSESRVEDFDPETPATQSDLYLAVASVFGALVAATKGEFVNRYQKITPEPTGDPKSNPNRPASESPTRPNLYSQAEMRPTG